MKYLRIILLLTLFSAGVATYCFADLDFAHRSPPIRYVSMYAQYRNSANNGTSWKDAYSQLPATLTRGATYYISKGLYPRHDFDDAESGTATITIIAASDKDHGSDIGWPTGSPGRVVFAGGIDIDGVSFSKRYYKFKGEFWQTGVHVVDLNRLANQKTK